ncbi:MAG TPA: hypothetical protein DCM87_19960 [Planctomycetes bacterium]|nr:hypothetical protein [Planctomycetota bacterium]
MDEMHTSMTANDMDALLQEARRGDRKAFERLIAAVEPRLDACIAARTGERLKQTLDVEDIKQETLLRAFSGIDGFAGEDEDSLVRWLAGIAEHVILYRRQRADVRGTARIEGDIPAADDTPSRTMRREERFERLKNAIAALSPEHREVIVLARVDRLPGTEIAHRMNRSRTAVAQLLSRALKKLRERFGDTESLSLPDRSLSEGGSDEQRP